jgi:putative oxidoreductase
MTPASAEQSRHVLHRPKREKSMRQQAFDDLVVLAARVLVALVFIYDAVLLVRAPAGNASYMMQYGVPALLLYPAALLEFVGGLMLVAGFAVRPVALALAGFCLLTALIFHHDLANAGEAIEFGKDIGLAGGLLCLYLQGAGALSFDAVRRRAPGRVQPG